MEGGGNCGCGCCGCGCLIMIVGAILALALVFAIFGSMNQGIDYFTWIAPQEGLSTLDTGFGFQIAGRSLLPCCSNAGSLAAAVGAIPLGS